MSAWSGYDAFGSLLPGRNYSSDSYRFGFNGSEKDDEMHGATGTSYDFGARLYDPRVGKWLSLDPLVERFPGWSPYNGFNNNPIAFVDPGGKTVYLFNMVGRDASGQPIVKAGEVSEKMAQALADIMCTEEGRQFVGQYAKAGQTIGGYTFEQDGRFACHDLVIQDISLEEADPDEPTGLWNEGVRSMAYNAEKNNVQLTIQVASFQHKDKYAVGETALHEMFLHGADDEDLIGAFDAEGKELFQFVQETRAANNPSGDLDHKAMQREDARHPGFGKYLKAARSLGAYGEGYKRAVKEGIATEQKRVNEGQR